jgi:hypothetical protein
MVYPALLPLMRTPLLPLGDRIDAPTDVNGLVRFAERRNLVSALVQYHHNSNAVYVYCFAVGVNRKTVSTHPFRG